jgi:hypothetical protein
MPAGATSLLRRITHTSGCAVLLGSVALALVPAAAVAAPAPDPSPVGAGGAGPDPYHAPQAPVERPRPVVVVQPRRVVVVRPAPIVITPVVAQPTHVATVAKKKAVRPRQHPHPHRGTPTRHHAKPVVVLAPANTFAPVVRRIPPLVSQVVSEVRESSRVSASVALVLACLVLLSGVLLVGAAREVAR